MKGPVRKLLGCLCAAGIGWLVVAAVSVGTASVTTASTSAAFRARALKVFRAELAREVGPMLRAGHYPRTFANGITQVGSFNWSGYADTSTTAQEFTKVAGSWTVPKVTCTPEDRIVALWVGLDGFSNTTVEQDGTSAQCFEGTALYYSWYEMYPAGSVVVSQGVKAGDKITASVTRSSTSYTLKVTDATTSGNNFSVSRSCALATCKDTSAEWIGERPAYSTGIVPLAEFGTPLSFTAGSDVAAGKTDTIGSGPGPNELTMIDSTQTYDLATPSSLTGGNAFTDKWDNSY